MRDTITKEQAAQAKSILGEYVHLRFERDMLESRLNTCSSDDSLRSQIAGLKKRMSDIEAAVSEINDPLEREVLRERYIEGKNNRLVGWQRVALSIYGDNDEKHMMAVFRLHGRALKSFYCSQKNVSKCK